MAQDKKLDIELGLVRTDEFMQRDERCVLTIETGKGYKGGVRSTATASWCRDGFMSHAFGLAGGGDFRRELRSDRTARATQKVIDTQYAAVFTDDAVAALVEEVKAYYLGQKGVRQAVSA